MEWNGRAWKDALRASMAECLLGITPDAAAKHAAHDVVKPTTASLFGR